AAFLARRVDLAGRVAVILKPGEASRFRLVRIDRLCFIITTARMRHVIDAAAQRPAVPGVYKIEGERGMDGNGRVQAGGGRPGLEGAARDRLARAGRGRHRQPAAVASDDVSALDKALGLHLQALERAVDIAHGAAAGALLTQHMPGLERLPELKA